MVEDTTETNITKTQQRVNDLIPFVLEPESEKH